MIIVLCVSGCMSGGKVAWVLCDVMLQVVLMLYEPSCIGDLVGSVGV